MHEDLRLKLPSLALLVNAYLGFARAVMHKMPLLLFPKMLGTQGQALP